MFSKYCLSDFCGLRRFKEMFVFSLIGFLWHYWDLTQQACAKRKGKSGLKSDIRGFETISRLFQIVQFI